MRYVFLGKLNPEWVNRNERFENAKQKAEALGIRLENVLYTQGQYDFVDLVSTDNPQSAVTFSVWYTSQGYGSITTLPAFTPEEFAQALTNV